MRIFVLLATVLLVASTSSGISATADTHFQLTRENAQSFTISLDVPQLEQREVELAGVRYQELSIPGGGHWGAVGQAAVPVITRLVAIPAGATVAAQVQTAAKTIRTGLHLPPRQPVTSIDMQSGKSSAPSPQNVVYDAAYYATKNSQLEPSITVGQPAWLFGQQVVPITFHPIKYDPATQSVTFANRMQVQFAVEAGSKEVTAGPDQRLVLESFQRMLRQAVLGYDVDGTVAGPGSYLYICPNNSMVISRLLPLVQWRLRQGYDAALVTLAETGYSTSAIKNYIQQVYDDGDIPLEFVCLVGDANGPYSVPTWFENVSGYHGEGDHYYTTLAGADLLPDIHIGRLSYQNLATLDTILDKIITYEITPPISDDPGWFQRAALVGDPIDSGGSTIFVNQWLKNQLLDLNYTEIDTIWSGNFPSRMLSAFNRGDTVVGYRGFYGCSNFTTGHVGILTNGYELPFVVMITCGTGSFYYDNSCMSEAWLRKAGGGGIAAISTSTSGTHTRYNNVMYAGIFEGLLNLGDFRAGPALSRGKLEMWLQYGYAEPHSAEAWMVWHNLMGDPATRIWTDLPQDLAVQHPSGLPVGATSVLVSVETNEGAAVSEALVALHKEGEILVSGRTDATGQALLPLANHTAGVLQVTVTGLNSLPYLGSLVLGASTEHLDVAEIQVDDDLVGGSQGNGDGLVSPGETVELSLQVTNLGTSSAPAVTAELTTDDSRVNMLANSSSFGTIEPGSAAWGNDPFVFELDAGTPGNLRISFTMNLQAGTDTWISLVEVDVHAGVCQVQDITWNGPGEVPQAGEDGTLSVELLNEGNLDIAGATAHLSTRSMWITPTDTEGSYGSLGMGQTAVNLADPFGLHVADDCYGGHLAALDLALEFQSGARDTVTCLLPVGQAAPGDPLGPDSYGYGAFDDTDVEYEWAPVFDWIEIDPEYGGSGTSVGLYDNGDYLDDTRSVDLPFTFTYYGQDFDKISICSNGWLAMGVTYLKNFRNLGIPCTGVPDNLLAVFWDDLRIYLSSDVLTWHDTVNGTFVVEWSRARNAAGGEVTFQAILFDPAQHPTLSGDGIIQFQYLTVSSPDNINGYHTVGIQADCGTDGLLYTYWNNYSPAAAPIEAGRAITILPMQPAAVGHITGHVDNASTSTPLPGATITLVGSGRTFISQADGDFMGSVQAGTHLVVASHPSCESDSMVAVSIPADETVVLNFALDDNRGPDFTSTTRLPDTEDTVGPYPVETSLSDISGLAEVHFYYETSTDPLVQELPMVLVDPPTGTYRAEIPGQSLETLVWYWLTATDIVGNQSSDPGEAPDERFRFAVVEVDTILHDDMETDMGWEVIPDGGGMISGRWERCDPNGTYSGEIMVQPEDDATPPPGIMCWITGNDQAGTDPGGHDVDGIPATLLSPWYDLSAYDGVTLSYQRWYTNNMGYNPNEDYWRVQVTGDGDQWIDVESTTESELSWALRSYRVEDFISLGPTIRFKFLATDEGDDSLVEAGLDEVVLTAYAIGPPTSVSTPLPDLLVLAQNRPNPFNPRTEIEFSLPTRAEVSLQVYDLEGRLVKSLVASEMPAGNHRVIWHGDDGQGAPVASGVYFYRLQTNEGSLVRKMTVLR